ncbi:hypothetical protein [Paenibacillus sp. FSL R5-0912]|uniref:hypothetical protein n=1 Tax=Paenibacillus sp. FSL R5-0912 TaxID=1536771 RepID=UPI000693BB5B|nr:hypothetical protein [Paenibacillus sp. FSL R5-0912]
MKIKAKQKGPLGRRTRLLLCLTLGLTLFAASASPPPALASIGSSRATVTQAVLQEMLPGLVMTQSPASGTLQDFTRLTISQLSTDAPFTEWKNAGTEVYPLGPGTRSWLVNVMNGEQRIGYLIISAADGGKYLLSEYGAGTYGLPYSMSDLRQYLVQEGLITSSYSGKIELSALYAPLLPVWKLTLADKTLYLNASVLQVLPWSLSQANRILDSQLDAKALVVYTGSGQQVRTPLPALLSGGQDDPYADLLWLTAPELKSISEVSLKTLLTSRGSLAFQSTGRNDALGAPFMITGCQSWLPASAGSNAGAEPAVIYAAAGPGAKRYLPLTALQKYGTFHKPPLPLSGGTTLGAAPH